MFDRGRVGDVGPRPCSRQIVVDDARSGCSSLIRDRAVIKRAVLRADNVLLRLTPESGRWLDCSTEVRAETGAMLRGMLSIPRRLPVLLSSPRTWECGNGAPALTRLNMKASKRQAEVLGQQEHTPSTYHGTGLAVRPTFDYAEGGTALHKIVSAGGPQAPVLPLMKTRLHSMPSDFSSVAQSEQAALVASMGHEHGASGPPAMVCRGRNPAESAVRIAESCASR